MAANKNKKTNIMPLTIIWAANFQNRIRTLKSPGIEVISKQNRQNILIKPSNDSVIIAEKIKYQQIFIKI